MQWLEQDGAQKKKTFIEVYSEVQIVVKIQ